MQDHEPPAFLLLPDSDEDADPQPDSQPAAGFSRPQRIAAAVIVAALAVTGIAVQRHRSAAAAHSARVASSAAAQAAASAAERSASAATEQNKQNKQPWPSIPGACGESVLVPLVRTAPLTERTGIRLLVGGAGQDTVELDTGKVVPTPGLNLTADTSVVAQQQVGKVQYLTTALCSAGAQVLRANPGQQPVAIFGQPFSADLLPDGAGGIWTSQVDLAGTKLADGKFQVDLVRLDKHQQLALPADYVPIAIQGNLVVAASGPGPQTGALQRLVFFDISQHRITRDLGLVSSYTLSQNVLMWTSQPCSAASTCWLHSHDLATGAESMRSYSLPVESSLTGGVLSPDHHRLAFALSRMSDDSSYYAGAGGEPSDLVVLDLRTGILEPIPNIELPPGISGSITFSRDSRWVVIGLNLAGGPQLLAWRSGLTMAMASSAKLAGPAQEPLLLQPIG